MIPLAASSLCFSFVNRGADELNPVLIVCAGDASAALPPSALGMPSLGNAVSPGVDAETDGLSMLASAATGLEANDPFHQNTAGV